MKALLSDAARVESMIALFGVAALMMQAAAPPPRWALAYQGKSTNDWIHDARSKALVDTRVPRRLSGDVYGGLSGPPDPVFVSDDRYVSMSAAAPHAGMWRGFFWIDTKTGVGLGGFFLESGVELGALSRGRLRLGSNGLTADRIPAPARAAVVDWLSFQRLKPSRVEFVGQRGGWLPLEAEEFQPRAEYEPPTSGPSFDCAKASGAVESLICRDSALATADLNLFNLVDGMRHGYGTTTAIAEIASMQRDWVARRDRECAAAPDMKVCLASQYQEQTNRLRHWIPHR